MNWGKVLMHGLKAFVFVLVASLLTVLIGALTIALGYNPSGIIDPTVWKLVGLPILVGIIGALQNALAHLPKE
jgi:hypothetical protein